MISINASYTNLVNQRTLATNTNELQKATKRLATGARINNAVDDAAGLFVGSALASSISSRKIALDNTMLASNFLNIADGALSNVSDNLMRMNQLATQACNGFMSTEARNALQNELTTLVNQSKQTIATTNMNGVATINIGNSVSSYNNMPKANENGFIADIDQQSEEELIAAGYVACTAENLANTSNKKLYINSASQLQALATYTNDGGTTISRTFVLSADIDLSSICSEANGVSWEAIGGSNIFRGTFDGNGHVVSNLYINSSADNKGLFGRVYTSIKNIGVENANVTGNSSTGALCGTCLTGNIKNCYATGTVNGRGLTGGLVGTVGGNITDCYSNVTVTSGIYDRDIGGLAGSAVTITNSFSTGDVSGNYLTGSLAGTCTSVVNSYATGNVTSSTTPDGLVGTVKINNCYATGLVNYEEAKDADLKSSFNSGALDSKWDTTGENPVLKHNGGNFIDAIVQQSESALISAGYVVCTTENLENTSNTKIYINSAEQLQALATYTNSGTGTTSGRTFTLSADIDLSSVCSAESGVSWVAIGTSAAGKRFEGTFDGNGHIISNLYVNAPTAGCQGLFGYAMTIKNLGVENANIIGKSEVGAVTGFCNSITNCWATGNVNGTSSVGVLAGNCVGIKQSYSQGSCNGINTVGGLIGKGGATNCYSTANVTGENVVGGLIGNAGVSSTSYATGNVNGKAVTGGLMGQGQVVSNCYSTGNVVSSTETRGLVGKVETINSYSSGLVNGEEPADAPKEPTIISFQISDGYDENSSIEYDCAVALAFGGLNLSTVESSQATLERIHELQNIVTQKQSYIGTQQNRLLGIATASQMTIENYSAAKSTIFDTDIAQEVANMTRSQILQQISVSVLSQSKNIDGQIVLGLIR